MVSISPLARQSLPQLKRAANADKKKKEENNLNKPPMQWRIRFFFSCLFNKDTNSVLFKFAGVLNDLFISLHSSFAMQLSILFRQQINVFSTILHQSMRLIWSTRRKMTYVPSIKSCKHHITARNIVSTHKVHKKNVNMFSHLSVCLSFSSFQLPTSPKPW